MMKLLRQSVLAVLVVAALGAPAFAHILKTDGSIGAVLHIDPADDPVAGSPANFYFDFKDKQGKFQLQDCDCRFSIGQNGQEISAQPLAGAEATYTFPAKGVYQVRVTGQPAGAASFQTFTLVYDIRVARDSAQPKSSSALIFWLSGGLIGIFIIIYLIRIRRHRS